MCEGYLWRFYGDIRHFALVGVLGIGMVDTWTQERPLSYWTHYVG